MPDNRTMKGKGCSRQGNFCDLNIFEGDEDPDAMACCTKVGGQWNETCGMCRFPDDPKAAGEMKDGWWKCYKAADDTPSMGWGCVVLGEDSAAVAVGPKMQLFAVVLGAALMTLF